jgi:hypothetical protein
VAELVLVQLAAAAGADQAIAIAIGKLDGDLFEQRGSFELDAKMRRLSQGDGASDCSTSSCSNCASNA